MKDMEKTATPEDLERIEIEIADIQTEPSNLNHIAKTGKINGSLLSELRKALESECSFHKKRINILEGNLDAYLESRDKLIQENARLASELEGVKAESNGKDEYLRKVMENVNQRRLELEALQASHRELYEAFGRIVDLYGKDTFSNEGVYQIAFFARERAESLLKK